jgi:uncharacterized protein (DUF952 family)
VILHIAVRDEWERAVSAGSAYVPSRFESDGFVHCSSPAQVLGPANRLFRGRTDLVLLVIDPARVAARVIEEPGDPGSAETFPHVYGPIELDAVDRVIDFPPGPGGRFALPDTDNCSPSPSNRSERPRRSRP